MNGAKDQPLIMECSLKYSLSGTDGEEGSGGEAQAGLSEEHLSLYPKYGEAILIPLRDISALSAGDYRLALTLDGNETVTLYHLGPKYDDFFRELSRARSALLLKDLLMEESLRRPGTEASCEIFDSNSAVVFEGKAELRLYETALVVIPGRGDPVRIPYSFLSSVDEEDYRLTLKTDFGDQLIFSMMGRGFAPFTEALSAIMNELSLKVQNSLHELLPDAGSAVIRKASRLMKEGKAARRGELEAISPLLWQELEKKLTGAGIKEKYDYLVALARREKLCIGVKRGLMGDLTGEYIWFLIPIYSLDPGVPGNAVAMEAASEESGGKATYFFRITGRQDYSGFEQIELLDQRVDAVIENINRCMLAINFRREPVYLPEARLRDPRYRKYRLAIQKIPALQELRSLFIGRVIHRSAEQWRRDVQELLAFNTAVSDDALRWEKGAADPEGGSDTA